MAVLLRDLFADPAVRGTAVATTSDLPERDLRVTCDKLLVIASPPGEAMIRRDAESAFGTFPIAPPMKCADRIVDFSRDGTARAGAGQHHRGCRAALSGGHPEDRTQEAHRPRHRVERVRRCEHEARDRRRSRVHDRSRAREGDKLEPVPLPASSLASRPAICARPSSPANRSVSSAPRAACSTSRRRACTCGCRTTRVAAARAAARTRRRTASSRSSRSVARTRRRARSARAACRVHRYIDAQWVVVGTCRGRVADSLCGPIAAPSR